MNIRCALAAASAWLLAGCVHLPETYASLECACPKGAPPAHIVSIQRPTGKWGVSGHGLAVYRETAQISLRLPEAPVARATYQASQLTLLEEGRARADLLTGGTVSIDRDNRTVVVALRTADGDFWANGSYSLRTP
jgi:hypothetical protein